MGSEIDREDVFKKYYPLFILAVLSIFSFGRIWFLRDVFWDDNCWILSAYSSANIGEFIKTGFDQLRRVNMGAFLYYFFRLHKTTPYAYHIWNSFSLVIQIASPVFLYLLFSNLYKKRHLLPFMIAACFIFLPIQTCVPYYSVIPYRLGVLLMAVSFYLTERAFAHNVRWIYLFWSLACAAVSHYVFLETTIILEPARLFLIWYLLFSKTHESKVLLKRAFLFWLPFFLLLLPVVFFKLLCRPFGGYAECYNQDMHHILDWKYIVFLSAMLMSYGWVIYIKNGIVGHYTSVWSIGSFVLTLAACVYIVHTMKMDDGIFGKSKKYFATFWQAFWKESGPVFPAFLFGVVLLVPAILLYGATNRLPSIGRTGSHGIILQLGDSVVIGCLLYLFLYSIAHRFGSRIFSICLVSILGLGVFFNNVNLDLYFDAWQGEKRFWNTFTARFPSVPENAVFLIDSVDDTPLKNSGLRSFHSLEFSLNALYAVSTDPKKFRANKALTVDDWELLRKTAVHDDSVIERPTHWGVDKLDPRKFIVIRYRNNEFLVNDEILKRYPGVSYRKILNKPFPELPAAKLYPLRQNVAELSYKK